jgi:hypothetical protein
MKSNKNDKKPHPSSLSPPSPSHLIISPFNPPQNKKTIKTVQIFQISYFTISLKSNKNNEKSLPSHNSPPSPNLFIIYLLRIRWRMERSLFKR